MVSLQQTQTTVSQAQRRNKQALKLVLLVQICFSQNIRTIFGIIVIVEMSFPAMLLSFVSVFKTIHV